MTTIHPERAMRVAKLTEQIIAATADVKILTKPLKVKIKQLNKQIKKILENAELPADPEDETNE
jgi:hypothetical protein